MEDGFMLRANLVRMLVFTSGVVATVAATSSDAYAFGRRRSCCDSSCYYTSAGNGHTISEPPPEPPCPPEPLRQVRAIYFSLNYSSWFEVDAMVPLSHAVVGVSTTVEVPKVGSVRGWVTSVYSQPRTAPPAASPAAAKSGLENDAAGYVRLWTSKSGKRQHYFAMGEISADSVKLKGADGVVYDVAFDSLCDTDANFLRGLSNSVAALDSSMIAAAIR
jgi:hypothetical protein